MPAIPAPVHPEHEVREWFSDVVLPACDVWVSAVNDGPIVGLLVLNGCRIEQLYVDPDWFGHGIGSRLLVVAKKQCPKGLDLWTFQSNHAARRFYERHGFTLVGATNGDNEEAAPDLRYRWIP